jgi:4-hydroxy-2-oxovalerate/4-hydroxy-2-oxohexanoate aldolase
LRRGQSINALCFRERQDARYREGTGTHPLSGVDLFKLMDVAEDIIVPMMDHLVRIDRESLTLGYAGVYSTFLLHAKRAAERFGVPARDILDTAMSMAKERGLLKDVVRAR